MRGFSDMTSRKKALNEFYSGGIWKQYRSDANSMILNNDNVHLLKPLSIEQNSDDEEIFFDTDWFENRDRIAVVDFYISNTKLDKLIGFVRKQYASILLNAGIEKTSFWVSETKTIDFAGLPVFQDKNLLVQITFYKDEFEYEIKMRTIDSLLNDQQKSDLADLITLKHFLIIYPK